jgi:hypothetical protein
MKDDTPEKLTNYGYARNTSPDSIEGLAGFARDHFATDFPNPERVDCSGPETYAELISRKQLPDEQLQAHLRACSECFNTYRCLLDEQRKTVILSPAWTRRVPWYKRILTVAIPLVLLCIALSSFYFFYQMRRRGSEQTVNSQPVQKREPAPANKQNDQTAIAERGTKSPEPIKSPPHTTIAAHTAIIDFASQNISRSASRREVSAASLVAGLNRLTLKLRPESPKGEYSLTLHDPFGKAVSTPVAGTFDGKVLRAELNLNSVSPGKYLICVTRSTELPDCLPAVVQAK